MSDAKDAAAAYAAQRDAIRASAYGRRLDALNQHANREIVALILDLRELVEQKIMPPALVEDSGFLQVFREVVGINANVMLRMMRDHIDQVREAGDPVDIFAAATQEMCQAAIRAIVEVAKHNFDVSRAS